ncbi:MAG: cupin domain-containing protein [Micrococcales bacterium]|nr:cupin domain-containing protein [Micrococcales bacterium]
MTLSHAPQHLDDLDEAPINPEWIREGAPIARASQWAETTDGRGTMHVWSCTAGTFDWHFDADELVAIVEGEVQVTDDAGTTTVLRPGDSALFVAGSHWVWHVPTYVRKHATLIRPLPASALTALRAAKGAVATVRTRLARS